MTLVEISCYAGQTATFCCSVSYSILILMVDDHEEDSVGFFVRQELNWAPCVFTARYFAILPYLNSSVTAQIKIKLRRVGDAVINSGSRRDIAALPTLKQTKQQTLCPEHDQVLLEVSLIVPYDYNILVYRAKTITYVCFKSLIIVSQNFLLFYLFPPFWCFPFTAPSYLNTDELSALTSNHIIFHAAILSKMQQETY